MQDRAMVPRITQIPLHSTTLFAQMHHRTEELLGYVNRRQDEGLLDRFDDIFVRQMRGVIDHHDCASIGAHLVSDRWRGYDEIEAEFTLEPLLRNLHMEQAKKARTKAEAERLRGFR